MLTRWNDGYDDESISMEKGEGIRDVMYHGLSHGYRSDSMATACPHTTVQRCPTVWFPETNDLIY